MAYRSKLSLLLCLVTYSSTALSSPTSQVPIIADPLSLKNQNISVELFNDLEELSRIVDIAYCVGTTSPGIHEPFLCASRCPDFDGFELVTVDARCGMSMDVVAET